MHWIRRRLAAAFLTLGFVVSSANAQSDWRDLDRVASIYVSVYDQVEDGCWPEPWATKEAVELVFRQANIPVAESLDPAGYFSSEIQHQFVISGFGWYMENDRGEGLGCIVSVMIKLWRPEKLAEFKSKGESAENNKWGIVYYGDTNWLGSSQTADMMQADITDSAIADATELANAILKAREDLKAKED